MPVTPDEVYRLRMMNSLEMPEGSDEVILDALKAAAANNAEIERLKSAVAWQKLAIDDREAEIERLGFLLAEAADERLKSAVAWLRERDG